MGFLMIPLTTVYDEYIDRSKLSYQKKTFEYIVPPPSIGVRTNFCFDCLVYFVFENLGHDRILKMPRPDLARFYKKTRF